MQKTFLSLAIGWCAGSLAFGASQNLVKDPGFEKTSTIPTTSGDRWWFSEGAGKLENAIDATVSHGGKASLRMRADTFTKGVVVSPKFDVSPGDELHFEAWVRISDAGTNALIGRAGLAFRRKDGTVIERNYFQVKPAGEWTLISGTARANAEVATAEVHLGYTNAPQTLWYDDVSAVITSPISFSLVDGAKPFTGLQQITVRVANHRDTPFHGAISCTIGKAVTQQPVELAANVAHDFKLPITLHGIGQHEYKIVLANPATGIEHEIQGKFHVASPLGLFPACPCYQVVGDGNSETRIDAHINVNPTERVGMKFVVAVSDESGKPVQTFDTSVGHGEYTGLKVRVPVDEPGVFNVTARLVDSQGKELASEKTDVHVVATNEAKVELGEDGFLRIDGKANFPIGIYNSTHTVEMGKAGFTATHDYEITTGEADEPINHNEAGVKELLDKSWASGMRAMIELPRHAVEKAKWEQVRRRVETFRHHPGLLCWGSEERVARGTAPLKNITALHELLHELDPGHPLVLGDTRDTIDKFKVDRRDFFPDPSMDIGIWWWYPIPLTTADGNGLEGAGTSASLMEPPSWLTTTHSQKPLWIAIQAYQKPSADARFPTPDEYRCQSYLSIINNAKGLWFYVGRGGQRDAQGKASGMLNKPELSHWDYVQKLAVELKAFTPVITSPKADVTLSMSPSAAPVEFATRKSDGKLYLIAANKSGQTQNVSFTGDVLANSKVRVLYEEHPVNVAGDVLADAFGAFGVHVYEIETTQ